MNNRLDQLQRDLGTSEAVDLLNFAIPFITEREALLRSLLLSGGLDEAAKCAHKTIGSLGLYGTDKLEGLLKEINKLDNNADDLIAFQEKLSAEFKHVLLLINEWLDAH